MIIVSDYFSRVLRNAQPHIGGVAQLGEHLPCKQGVSGSNPLVSMACDPEAARVGLGGRGLRQKSSGR